MGNKAVQEAYAGARYYDCDVALVITNSTLTGPAKELAKNFMLLYGRTSTQFICKNTIRNFLNKRESAKKGRKQRKTRRKENESSRN